MIKHFCDKCQAEITDGFKVSVRICNWSWETVDNFEDFELCPNCLNKLREFYAPGTQITRLSHGELVQMQKEKENER